MGGIANYDIINSCLSSLFTGTLPRKTVQMRSGLFHPPREELTGSAPSLLLRGHRPGNPHLRGGNNGVSVVTVLLEKSSTMNLHPKKTPPPSRLARRSPLHAGKLKVERDKQKDSL